MNRDHGNLGRLIREHGFVALEEQLMSLARPSVRVMTTRVSDENEIPVGASKVGGCPDLPPHLNWVTVAGHQGKESVSLPFVAQFDLRDVKPYDVEDLLPAAGMLYFFADPWRARRHADHGKVLYYTGDKSLLARKAFPDDIPLTPPDEWGERYDPCTVTLIPEVNLPVDDESLRILEQVEGKTAEACFDLLYAASYNQRENYYPETVNRLLGCNYDIPADMPLKCELTAMTGSPFDASTETKAAAELRKNEWQLLLQMGSDDNAAMMWSDVGKICFYIRREDLRQADFSQICLSFYSA